jgi:hypothetical protein
VICLARCSRVPSRMWSRRCCRDLRQLRPNIHTPCRLLSAPPLPRARASPRFVLMRRPSLTVSGPIRGVRLRTVDSSGTGSLNAIRQNAAADESSPNFRHEHVVPQLWRRSSTISRTYVSIANVGRW